MHVSSLLEVLAALNTTERRTLYSRLWFELTTGTRALLDDPDLSDAEKLAGLRCFNDIQHRAWHAHMDPDGYTPPMFLDKTRLHLDDAPHARAYAATCFRNALENRTHGHPLEMS